MVRQKRFSLIGLLVFALAIFGLWFADLFAHWSEQFIWFDMVLHFLGGLWVGLALFWLLERVRKPAFEPRVSILKPRRELEAEEYRDILRPKRSVVGQNRNSQRRNGVPEHALDRYGISSLATPFYVIVIVVAIGLLWEVYQYGVHVAFPGSEYGGFVDSLSDMFFDTLGATVAVVMYKWGR